MREIKFRAWRKKCGFAWFRLGNNPVWNGEYNENHGYYFTSIEGVDAIDQFTGLQDKNGVDIYEGDIVRISNGSINGSYWFEKNRLIKFQKAAFNVPVFCIGEKQTRTHWCEVIGNIHENPELLEAGE